MEVVKGIVISCNKYKDKDAIINVLTENSIVPIIVRSAFSKNSKYLMYTHVPLYGEFEVYTGGTKYLKLRGGINLIDYSSFGLNYDCNVCIELIKEIILKSLTEDSLRNYYLLLLETLKNIKELKEPFKYTFLFLSFFIRFSGYKISVDKCLRCNTNNELAALSFEDGTLVCDDCLKENDIKLEKNEAKVLIVVFSKRYKEAQKILVSNESSYKKLILILIEFLSFYNGVQIISKKLIF